MAADPQETIVVANAIIQLLARRGGAVNATLAGVHKASPETYHQVMEEAEVILEALEYYRGNTCYVEAFLRD